MPVTLGPDAIATFIGTSGAPLANGYVCSFAAGTTTPQATYTDSSGTVQNSNPTILNAAGRASIWFIASAYKIVLHDPGGDGTCGPGGGTVEFTTDNFQVAPFLAGNNAWTGNQTFAGTSIFNGAVTFTAGGAMAGTFTGSPTFSGNPTFSGGPIFTASPNFSAATPVWSTKIQSNLNPAIQSVSIANNAGGTILNSLAKLTGAPSTALTPLVTDTTGAVGIVIAGAGNTGSATIQNVGLVNCNFDAATTAGDYVIFSVTVAGDCHDVPGGGFPSSGQVMGRVLSTNGAAGLYQMNLFASEDRSLTPTMAFPNVVFSTALAATNAPIVAQTMTTVGASSATYQFTWYADITTIGTSCTGSTTISPNLIFQDPNAAGTTTNVIAPSNTQTVAFNNNGVVGPIFALAGATVGINTQVFTFRAKPGTVIQYSMTYALGTGCSPGPLVQFFPILEQLTAN